jgi:CRISPR-associated protein Cmr2
MEMQSQNPITTAIAWCAAWGEEKKPQYDLSLLQQMRQALNDGKDEDIPQELRSLVKQVQQLQAIPKDYFPEKITELWDIYPDLWKQTTQIGLIHGGATKIKQYVFEATKLPDIRGASGLLDRINLIDLPAFFNKKPEFNYYNIHCQEVRSWLNRNFTNTPSLSDALIPELIIYSTGGKILAFCPAAFIDDLTNAIEKRYTEETLTANSCAVGDKFRLLEIRFGLLKNNLEETFWLEDYQREYKNNNPIVEACFGLVENDSELVENFKNRKSFNELTTKLAIRFNQRRSGNDSEERPSKRNPPIFETSPYLKRDEGERRSAITQVTQLPGETAYFSETSVRKRLVGDKAKMGLSKTPQWYKETNLTWESAGIEGWVDKFAEYLEENQEQYHKYCRNFDLKKDVKVAQSLTHLSKVSNGYVAYIYADGNNMGGYIQKIRTPEEYKEFSEDVDNATKYAVYQALAHNLNPRKVKGINDAKSTIQDGDLINPFEILTIGGDDIMLVVPGDKALEIAKMIGEEFENILLKKRDIKNVQIKGNYQINLLGIDLKRYHRIPWYSKDTAQCKLSMSSGVLITSYNTPIYYAEKLTTQLLKSAKKRAKKLKEYRQEDKKEDKRFGYYGGTVDFLTMKSVTMISSNIDEFRKQALIKKYGAIMLKLYAAPYTLHELGGLLQAIAALKKARFPKSQLYQIRSFLEQGKQTAILNYRYFRVRLKQGQTALKNDFENTWCKPKNPNNGGNLAPWMHDSGEIENPETPEAFYETIWREMVDLYDFIDIDDNAVDNTESTLNLLQEVDS